MGMERGFAAEREYNNSSETSLKLKTEFLVSFRKTVFHPREQTQGQLCRNRFNVASSPRLTTFFWSGWRENPENILKDLGA